MKTISLNGIWNLSGKPEEENTERIYLNGEVPGCVQLDLSREGFLPSDLYMGENITETEKYECYEWWYEKTFNAPKERENVYLVFEGVDCVAEYFLNGVKFGTSENMFIAHEFNVSDCLKEGENLLAVHIKSPVVAAHNKSYTAESSLTWHSDPVRTGIRNTAHSWGWDIMPRAVTSGLWREVRLEVRDKIYFSQVYFDTTESSARLFYELACRHKDLKDVEIEVTGSCGDSAVSARHNVKGTKAGLIDLNIIGPKKWWPYGYGEANVYDCTLKIYSEGCLIHEKKDSFGLRTVVLDRTETTDGKNGRFRFLINGTEIMCKGSNWVPLDAFHSRDAERYDKALALVSEAGCNILRCWGGNVYEDHKFFDYCDRHGIMVWQDFAMACHFYPQTKEFYSEIRKEAEAVVRKLRNHPSIVLWAGDNEIDYYMFVKKLDPSTNKINREVLPKVVAFNDFSRPYLPSSPYYSEGVCKEGKRPPEDHLWGPRDYFKSNFYVGDSCHFISETGYHGCPDLESIKKFITPDKVWPYHNNSEWILHSSDQEGNDSRVMLMEKQVRQLFLDVPTDPEDYILASQISQAEADKFFIERMRAGRPDKSGIIWWNILDGWPQMSDAVVGYYFDKKLAFDYIKRSQAPFVIVIDEPDEWNVKIKVCNDTLKAKSGVFEVIDALTDEVLCGGEFNADVNSTTVIGSMPFYYSEHKFLIIKWESDGEEGFNHYLMGYPPISLSDYKKFMEKLGRIK